MSATKRPRTSIENDDVEASPTIQLLTHGEVKKLTSEHDVHRDTLLKWLSNPKDPDKKLELREAINYFSSAYLKISNAYLLLIGSRDQPSKLNSIYDNLVEASNTLSNIASELSTTNPQRSYSDVAQQMSGTTNVSRSHKTPANKVIMSHSKPIQIDKVERVVVGPNVDAEEKYPTSKETKEALIKAINPVDLKMKVKRTILGPQATVIIEGHLTRLQ